MASTHPPENGVLADTSVCTWQWGLTPAYNTVRLMLQWLRDRLTQDPENAELIGAVTEVDLRLRRVSAVRHTLAERLAQSPNTAGYVDLAQHVNTVMSDIHLPEVLAVLVNEATAAFILAPHAVAADGEAAAAVLHSALAVEVISKALHARLPQQPHAPFDLLRLGPDVAAPVLVDSPATQQDEPGFAFSALASALGGSKLYGTQVFHFGAFGQQEWREWDWLWGRLESTPHLGPTQGCALDYSSPPRCCLALAVAVADIDAYDTRVCQKVAVLDRPNHPHPTHRRDSHPRPLPHSIDHSAHSRVHPARQRMHRATAADLASPQAQLLRCDGASACRHIVQ